MTFLVPTLLQMIQRLLQALHSRNRWHCIAPFDGHQVRKVNSSSLLPQMFYLSMRHVVIEFLFGYCLLSLRKTS